MNIWHAIIENVSYNSGIKLCSREVESGAKKRVSIAKKVSMSKLYFVGVKIWLCNISLLFVIQSSCNSKLTIFPIFCLYIKNEHHYQSIFQKNGKISVCILHGANNRSSKKSKENSVQSWYLLLSMHIVVNGKH